MKDEAGAHRRNQAFDASDVLLSYKESDVASEAKVPEVQGIERAV